MVLKCIRCGYSEFKGSMHIHHLDKNHSNNEQTNLIVLCANCHLGYHHNKWKLEEIGIKTPLSQKPKRKSKISLNGNTKKSTRLIEINTRLENANKSLSEDIKDMRSKIMETNMKNILLNSDLNYEIRTDTVSKRYLK